MCCRPSSVASPPPRRDERWHRRPSTAARRGSNAESPIGVARCRADPDRETSAAAVRRDWSLALQNQRARQCAPRSSDDSRAGRERTRHPEKRVRPLVARTAEFDRIHAPEQERTIRQPAASAKPTHAERRGPAGPPADWILVLASRACGEYRSPWGVRSKIRSWLAPAPRTQASSKPLLTTTRPLRKDRGGHVHEEEANRGVDQAKDQRKEGVRNDPDPA